MANESFPRSTHFKDNTIFYKHPKLPAAIELEGLGVKIRPGEEVKKVTGSNSVIDYAFPDSSPESPLPGHRRFRATSSHHWPKGETITITGEPNFRTRTDYLLAHLQGKARFTNRNL